MWRKGKGFFGLGRGFGEDKGGRRQGQGQGQRILAADMGGRRADKIKSKVKVKIKGEGLGKGQGQGQGHAILLETDLLLWCFFCFQKLSDGVKHNLKALIVFLLHIFNFRFQLIMRGQQLT